MKNKTFIKYVCIGVSANAFAYQSILIVSEIYKIAVETNFILIVYNYSLYRFKR